MRTSSCNGRAHRADPLSHSHSYSFSANEAGGTRSQQKYITEKRVDTDDWRVALAEMEKRFEISTKERECITTIDTRLKEEVESLRHELEMSRTENDQLRTRQREIERSHAGQIDAMREKEESVLRKEVDRAVRDAMARGETERSRLKSRLKELESKNRERGEDKKQDEECRVLKAEVDRLVSKNRELIFSLEDQRREMKSQEHYGHEIARLRGKLEEKCRDYEILKLQRAEFDLNLQKLASMQEEVSYLRQDNENLKHALCEREQRLEMSEQSLEAMEKDFALVRRELQKKISKTASAMVADTSKGWTFRGKQGMGPSVPVKKPRVLEPARNLSMDQLPIDSPIIHTRNYFMEPAVQAVPSPCRKSSLCVPNTLAPAADKGLPPFEQRNENHSQTGKAFPYGHSPFRMQNGSKNDFRFSLIQPSQKTPTLGARVNENGFPLSPGCPSQQYLQPVQWQL